mgnify:CR=1 FL=1
MTIEELYDLLKSEFPQLNWQRREYFDTYIVADTKNGEYLARIGQFNERIHNGCEYISVGYNSNGPEHYRQSGPYIGWEKAKSVMMELIKRYDPKLFQEEQQLTLF